MKVEVWNDDDSTTVLIPNDYSKSMLLGDNPILIRTIEGEDWDDCMRQHNELMGWEAYKPF